MKRLGLFILFGLVLLLAACKEPAERTRPAELPPVQVKTRILTLKEVPAQVEVAGTVKAVEHALISARVSGQIVELPVRIGSRVKKGELLMRLRADEIDARVNQAKTQLAQARRNLEREEKLMQVQASTPERVRTLREQVQLLEAAWREARTLLDYTYVRAPFAATVTEKMVEAGDLATPGKPLLALENSRALEVVVDVPEALVNQLSVGRMLPVTIPAAHIEISAAIREISPTVDPATRSVRIKLDLPDNPALRSGQFARVGLPDASAKTLLVERDALHRNGQMEQVFVVRDGRAVLRLVRSGARYGDSVEILTGLEPGDEIIVEAAGRLHDGQPVTVGQTESAQ